MAESVQESVQEEEEHALLSSHDYDKQNEAPMYSSVGATTKEAAAATVPEKAEAQSIFVPQSEVKPKQKRHYGNLTVLGVSPFVIMIGHTIGPGHVVTCYHGRPSRVDNACDVGLHHGDGRPVAAICVKSRSIEELANILWGCCSRHNPCTVAGNTHRSWPGGAHKR